MGFWLTRYWVAYMPHLFGSPVPVVEIGASAVGTHLAGTMIYILIGLFGFGIGSVKVYRAHGAAERTAA
jgi:hypothetical protein